MSEIPEGLVRTLEAVELSAPFALFLLAGERFEGEWLAPLDGFAVQRGHEGNLVFIWHGRRQEVAAW